VLLLLPQVPQALLLVQLLQQQALPVLLHLHLLPLLHRLRLQSRHQVLEHQPQALLLLM
jgi:hypothetical protein